MQWEWSQKSFWDLQLSLACTQSPGVLSRDGGEELLFQQQDLNTAGLPEDSSWAGTVACVS